MATYQFIRTQKIPTTVENLWSFVSSPHNLKEITPKSLNFKVLTPNLPKEMYAGMIITYKVSPLLGIPLSWCTEITHVSPLKYFVDEQREGPYTFWHHQHHLEPIEGGVLMTDIVHYRIPFGWLGQLMNTLLVKHELARIFSFRFNKMEALFGKMA